MEFGEYNEEGLCCKNEPFLLLNADAVFDVDFNRMVRFHQEHGGLVTLFTHPNNHPYDSGLIIAEKDMSVRSWLAKEDVRPTYYKNRVNAGLHVIDNTVGGVLGGLMYCAVMKVRKRL